MSDDETVIESDVPDLSDVSLAQLMEVSVQMDLATRRLTEEVSRMADRSDWVC